MMDTIGKLKQIRDYMNSSPFPKPEFGDACDEAIKALENQQKYEIPLTVEEQVRLIHDKCPDIWKDLKNNKLVMDVMLKEYEQAIIGNIMKPDDTN
ncbi:hypothetical protein [Propionispira raffinosivorans]|uniref:hypothetical protein n=1 Tax=Propionispira raffinosivorans TaxID=86959 RepID=UPI000368B58F|nr:hypothetical protein [Propionispira raffinosivorans]